MQSAPWIVLIAVLLVVALAAVIHGVVQRRRRDELHAVSRRLGLSFQPQADLRPRGFGQVPLFSHGRRRRFTNILSPTDDADGWMAFDYQYTVSGGKNSHTVRQTVAAMTVPDAGIPAFELSPESFGHKIAAVFGYRDIDFDDYPEFSRHYLLRGRDEHAVRRFFDHRRLRHFQDHPGWCVQAGDGWMVVYRARRIVKPAEFGGFIDEARQLRRVFSG